MFFLEITLPKLNLELSLVRGSYYEISLYGNVVSDCSRHCSKTLHPYPNIILHDKFAKPEKEVPNFVSGIITPNAMLVFVGVNEAITYYRTLPVVKT